MGTRVDLDGCGKSRLDRDSIPGPSIVNQCRDKNTRVWRLLGSGVEEERRGSIPKLGVFICHISLGHGSCPFPI